MAGARDYSMQAWAECAWVLWEGTVSDAQRVEWALLGAVATLQACESEKALHKKMGDVLAKIETKPAPYLAWRCLPDTNRPARAEGGRAVKRSYAYGDYWIELTAEWDGNRFKASAKHLRIR